MSEKIAKLFLEPAKPTMTGEVFLSHEENEATSGLGRLFAIINIESRERGLKERMGEFMAWLEQTYYASPVPDIENSLEAVCQQINEAWFEFFDKPEGWHNKANFLVGVMGENTLVFSSWGKFSAYLVRHKKITPILNSPIEFMGGRLLTQITSGEIKPDDAIIFANYNLFDFFSLEKIREVLEKINPQSASEHLKNLLLESPKVPSVIGLILRADSLEIMPIATPSASRKYIEDWYGSQESMQQLENLEKRTGRTLTASVWPVIQKIGRLFRRHSRREEKKEARNLKLPAEKRSVRKNKISQFIVNVIKDLKALISGVVGRVGKNRRLLLIFLAILIILIGGSIGYLKWHQQQTAINNKFQDIIDQAVNKKDQAEAALIYDDKEKASQLLNEGLTLLNDNSVTAPLEWQDKIAIEKQTLQSVWNKINNIFELTNVNKLTVNLLPGQEVSQLLTNKDGIYALSSGGVFYQLNLSDNLTKELWRQEQVEMCSAGSNAKWWCVNQENKFLEINNSGEEKKLAINLTDVAQEINVYNDKIYVLNNITPAILKINQPTSEAAAASNWYLGDKSLIKDAKSMMIDGNVWLVKENNIIKLFKGKPEVFSLAKLTAPLSDDLLIYTEMDWTMIYVLDKANGRLLVSDKNGNINKQFLNEQFKSAKVMVINGDNALLSDGNNVYQMSLKIN